MRRIGAAILLPLATALALAGCGSSAAPPASPNATVTAVGHFGAAPTVKIPAEKASSDLYIKTEVHGTGPVLAKNDSFLSNYAVYIWSGASHKLALSTFTATPQVLANTLLPGLTKALDGQKMGSQVLKTLIKGSGPPVVKGQYVVTQYVGLNWRTRAVFDSSWSRGTPLGFEIDATPAQIIPGWDMGLVGVPVGSRVMLVVPPKDGYGKAGASTAGIKGTDTLVFVVDVLDAVNGSSH